MTEQLLHLKQTYSGHDRHACECVAEVMDTEILDPSFAAGLLERLSQVEDVSLAGSWLDGKT